MNTSKNNIIIKNKKASRNYHLTDKYQAGIVLEGWEVKGLRNGKVDIKDSYVMLKDNEAWVIGLKIDPPPSLKNDNVDSTRSRKLLLNKREISSILDAVAQKGLTCILTSIYWKENKIKCDIAIGKGKKNYDQREDVKKRDWNREKQRILKNSNR
ncbi:MAG: SsrA-binding protein [Gammaproteobacteria bacterium]|jgi:SsrA-binding protein|nr:SsrA-binding protein [Gammaproteobacteria bacterium]|tara:strand:+ start:455 stop:919 length:465 start_codon:yes stop_codon:yes gene_type:complete